MKKDETNKNAGKNKIKSQEKYHTIKQKKEKIEKKVKEKRRYTIRGMKC
jgi:hypothetical protein